MLTHATLHGGCMDTATESALKIDAERKTLAEPGNGTASVLRLAFRSDPLAADLPRPLQSVCTTVTDLTTMRRCLHSCPCDVSPPQTAAMLQPSFTLKKKKKSICVWAHSALRLIMYSSASPNTFLDGLFHVHHWTISPKTPPAGLPVCTRDPIIT